MFKQTLKVTLAVSAISLFFVGCSDSTPTSAPTQKPVTTAQTPAPASTSSRNTKNPSADMMAATQNQCQKNGGVWDGQKCSYGSANAGGGQAYPTAPAQTYDYSQWEALGGVLGAGASQIKLPTCPNSGTCPNKQ